MANATNLKDAIALLDEATTGDELLEVLDILTDNN